MKLFQLMKLLFVRDRFVKEATEHSIKSEFERNKQFAERYPNGVLPPDKIKEFQSVQRALTKEIRHSIGASLRLVIIIAVAAGLSSLLLLCYSKPLSIYITPWTYVLSAVVLLWAVLAKVGWSIQTMAGDSLPEQLNEVFFRFLMAVGTYSLLFGLFLGIFNQILF